MRSRLLPLAAALAAAALTAGIASAHHDPGSDGEHGNSNDAYAIGLWGDLPYNDTQKATGVPNLIADMNNQRLAFTAHDGDLKSGSSPCTDDVYTTGLGYFNSLKSPAAFTPGDNDWTDCDRGAYSSRERLDHERQVFFGQPYSLGRHPMRQEVQRTPLCLGVAGGVPCVENRRWTVGRVTYVTLNVQGSCNNLCDVAPDPAEYEARNRANIAWMQETFDRAKRRGSVAVMLISQADPGWDDADPTRGPSRNPKTLVEDTASPTATTTS